MDRRNLLKGLACLPFLPLTMKSETKCLETRQPLREIYIVNKNKGDYFFTRSRMWDVRKGDLFIITENGKFLTEGGLSGKFTLFKAEEDARNDGKMWGVVCNQVNRQIKRKI